MGGIELPEIYKDVADTPIEELAANRFSKRDVSNGLNVLFITTYDANNKNLYINYIRQGAIVISSAIFEDEMVFYCLTLDLTEKNCTVHGRQ